MRCEDCGRPLRAHASQKRKRGDYCFKKYSGKKQLNIFLQKPELSMKVQINLIGPASKILRELQEIREAFQQECMNNNTRQKDFIIKKQNSDSTAWASYNEYEDFFYERSTFGVDAKTILIPDKL